MKKLEIFEYYEKDQDKCYKSIIKAIQL